jgi:hypothetical protein
MKDLVLTGGIKVGNTTVKTSTAMNAKTELILVMPDLVHQVLLSVKLLLYHKDK